MAILELGLDSTALSWEDLAKLHVRRLAQLEVQLRRIADTMELQLKLQAVKAGVSLSAIRDAEWEAPTPAGKDPMELLQQTPEELAALENVHAKLVERFGAGNVPLGLDLYAELAKEAPGNTDEEA